MSYFGNCSKCNKRIEIDSFRYQIDGDWICLDCYELFLDVYRDWVKK